MTLALYRGRGQVWQRQGDPIPPPPSKVTTPYIGFAIDGTSQWAALSERVGGLLVRRSYNSLGDGVPASFASSAAKPDAGLGATISYLSIRTDPAATASGSLDGKLTAFAKSCPPGLWFSWWAEGEAQRQNGGSGYNPATFASALRRVYQVMKSANSQINIGPCWMTYSLTSGHGFPLDDWYSGPLSDSGDFIGWDGYNPTVSGWQSFADIFGPAVTWTRTRSDLPIVISECNSVADPSNAGRRGAWWAGVWDYAAAQKMPLVCGWSGASVPQYDIFSPDDTPALDAITTLNSTAKAART